MSFWQNLVDSYDKNADALKTTYPLSTTSISNNSDIIAVIVIDGNGNFQKKSSYAAKIEKVKKDKKAENYITPPISITIPVTEESMGRSSGICPHPVFDQYGYLKGDGKKYDAYITQLKDFAESTFATKQIEAIYKYVGKRSIATDLSEMDPKDKTYIIFQVETPGNPQTKVWENEIFYSAWHQYYLAEKRKKATKKKCAEEELEINKKLSSAEKKNLKELIQLKDMISLDYITGDEHQPIATFHPKKISNATANSKLVSDNDKTNYTFRGKFSESFEVVSIGYETSQKAHQFLRYLINDRGYFCGEQVILSFTVGSTKKLLPPPVEDGSLSAFMLASKTQTQTESDSQIVLSAETGFDYADALKNALSGFRYGNNLERHNKTAVITLDAATTGRLAITFYRELDRSEYLEKIADWHYGCKWNQKFWDKENNKYVPYRGAPSADKIIEAVYGKPRGRKDESYIKIKKAARERLIRCIFDGAFLPKDYVVAAVRRTSCPLGITKDGKFDRNGFERILATTCALIRKHYQQGGKEDFKLSIELERADRDYLYGRLLGAADKLEEYALYKKNNSRIVTAAIRHMQTFAQHPFRAWQTIHSCLNPHIQAVKGGFAFNEIQEIMQQFISGDYEKNTPLNGSYLIGYYHERAYIDSLVKKATDKKELTVNGEQEANND
ncbi:type I-C CRISPR-associated protein Cas8c/Csd1 [Syntrophotalea acetylenica]|uniref:type I-C CRISPR-associated protein Cas8c/Csd1 n=1 Tax=Syntrophotalea acetylenica TaxID=29542 RepID=UPI002A3642D1|nr:type I-C CRISPR-associated protein Cas8c/Csd1 [Syntrophotalea acetylenica]MDY0263438.1 type I-C CRISPR-associated protein Cas8c/Csd1 [Syntrophotalea acetylenica]